MNFKLRLSPENPNTTTYSEDLFASGEWERRGGRKQTVMFAKFFHRHVVVPFSGKFSLLDVGCALGDAMTVWKRKYPQAELFGCDISQYAVDKANERYGAIATFRRASFEEIGESYDICFCSNVLEHFEQHVEIARFLLEHCRILYVMTPYAEMNGGKPLKPAKDAIHVATFLEDSFSALEDEGVASVTTKVVRCPRAWGPSVPGEVLWHVRYLFGLITSPSPPRRQIIYSIVKR